MTFKENASVVIFKWFNFYYNFAKYEVRYQIIIRLVFMVSQVSYSNICGGKGGALNQQLILPRQITDTILVTFIKKKIAKI